MLAQIAQTTQPTIFTGEVLAAISGVIILVVGALGAALVKWISSVADRASKATTKAEVANTTANIAVNQASANTQNIAALANQAPASMSGTGIGTVPPPRQ